MPSYRKVPQTDIEEAQPEARDGAPGYSVTLNDGRTIWRSEEVFTGMIHKDVRLTDYVSEA